MILDLIADTEGLMEEALDEAKDKGINEDDIQNILLVGGSTRIPAVSKLIKKKFNKDPLTGVMLMRQYHWVQQYMQVKKQIRLFVCYATRGVKKSRFRRSE